MAVEKVALIVSDFEGGGVERTFANLATGLAQLGVATDLIVGCLEHPYLTDLAGTVRVLPLPNQAEREAWLRGYLERDPPDVLVTGKLADDFATLAARQGLSVGTRIVAAVGTVLSARFAAHRFNPLRTWRETRRIRDQYGRLDGITAVSEAVADDLRRVFQVSRVPLAVLPNPLIPDALEDLTAAPCPHPWFATGQPPVILAIGGLRKVKDFPTLVRAVARLSARVDCRLVILGEGKERGRLLALAKRLHIRERIDLPGFVEQPFPYLKHAALLALSSRREGLPNVLVEAMALGTPVVATDCQGGVRGLLQGGQLGPLVPVGNPAALAAALAQTLAIVNTGRLDRATLRQAAEPYRIVPAARTHLAFFRSLPGLTD